MKPASFAPAYCALYPQLAEVARLFGYALAVHGSMGRDFDLVLIPWELDVGHPIQVITNICDKFAMTRIGEPECKEHGRIVWTLSIGFGECFVDLSFMPSLPIASVTNIDDKRKIWNHGGAKCSNCGKQWVAVYAFDSNSLECPYCGNMTGAIDE